MNVSKYILACVLTFLSISFAYAAPVTITNGSNAKTGQFPFMVELELQGQPVIPSHMGACGGTLWVLTAGHCADDYFKGYMPQAIIGATTLTNADKPNYQVINVDKIFIHPNFKKYRTTKSKGNLAYDFALLHLTHPSTIKPISLIGSHINLTQVGKVATVIGWGSTGKTGSDQLKFANVSIDTGATCNKYYTFNNTPWFNNNLMICTGSLSKLRTNAARGDSGGPLIANDLKTNKRYLVGVVSWGDPNDPTFQENHPVVYARVAAVQSWINNTINDFDETGK